jgi:acyl-CoA reductase-like NAD-dependent aldehyde dehydrogenase
VHKDIYDTFVDEFIKELKSYQLGNPNDAGIYFGSLTRGEQIKVLEQQVQDAVAKGAKLLTGGKRMARKGYYFEPTVLVNVDHTMSVMRDESFGPIIGIQKVDSDEEAVRLMLDTEYGLTAAIYSSNRDRAQAMMQKMNSGTVYWNCCDRLSPYLPWSGRKHSGIGVTLSYLGIRAFTRPKAYHFRG